MSKNLTRFIVKDLSENQWYTVKYKGHKTPNFSSSKGYATKYKLWLIAKIRAMFLGGCTVETIIIN